MKAHWIAVALVRQIANPNPRPLVVSPGPQQVRVDCPAVHVADRQLFPGVLEHLVEHCQCLPTVATTKVIDPDLTWYATPER
jgi:hypothetical protein